jgi:anthranilate synthase
VTVTGAPKPWAIQFVEDNEETERKWYAGAVGLVGFDGHLNTGLTLRTIHIQEGVASVRAGATLLFDSDPEAEEKETELKASAFRDAILRPRDVPGADAKAAAGGDQSALGGVGPLARDGVAGLGKRVLLVDHQDSFVHTLANYLRQTGADVTTCRFGLTRAQIEAQRPDLVVLSPGPGRPSDFKLSDTLSSCISLGLPVFGVCLGLQGIVEHFGGKLSVLGYPMHGKPSDVKLCGGDRGGEGRVKEAGGCLFRELPKVFTVARYHSLYATEVPAMLSVTATVEGKSDGSGAVVMAVEHNSLPIAAVQVSLGAGLVWFCFVLFLMIFE